MSTSLIANEFKLKRMEANKDIVYPELSYQIVGVMFEVHKALGNRLQEKYYQKAVALGLSRAGLSFKEQVVVPIEYAGQSIGRYFLDFVIEDKVALELKTLPKLDKESYDQVLAYLNVLRLKLGILVNFRTQSLSFKRLINPRVLAV